MLLPRLTNVIKILSGYVISRLIRRVVHAGKPIAVSIEPTNSCNLHCPECPSGLRELSRPRGMMTMQTFRTIIDQLSPELAYLTLYFQGEPFMNNRFNEMVTYAKSKDIFVSSSTNGQFMDQEMARRTVKSGLNRLVFSLDGTDQTSYGSYRIGGSFEQVKQGISHLVEARRNARTALPKIIIQFLVLKTNEHQIKEIKLLGRSLSADKVEIKTAQFYDYAHGNPLMPENFRYSRYRRTGGRVDGRTGGQADGRTGGQANGRTSFYVLKNRLPRHCFRMWSGCVFTWDGKIVPCCYDKDATHQLGDMNLQPFADIWKSEKYRDFRQQILQNREMIEICQNCSEGMGMSAIW